MNDACYTPERKDGVYVKWDSSRAAIIKVHSNNICLSYSNHTSNSMHNITLSLMNVYTSESEIDLKYIKGLRSSKRYNTITRIARSGINYNNFVSSFLHWCIQGEVESKVLFLLITNQLGPHITYSPCGWLICRMAVFPLICDQIWLLIFGDKVPSLSRQTEESKFLYSLHMRGMCWGNLEPRINLAKAGA